MTTPRFDGRLVGLLMAKDWQLYQRQFAACVLAMLLALVLIGTGQRWPFYLGALLLMTMLICVGGLAIQSSLNNERKEQTLVFVMSLPVTPLDVFWGKLLVNLIFYLAPMVVVVAATCWLVLYTPLPDGLLVWAMLMYGFLSMTFFLTLAVALVVESEGWIHFTLIGLSSLISPYMMWLGSIDSIGPYIPGEQVVWSPAALGLLAGQGVLSLLALAFTGWRQSHKTAFL